MSVNLSYLLVVSTLYATGIFLLLERSLTRVLLGILLMSNATNVLILASGGAAGGPPLVGTTAPEDMSDPLPQAMILTAIVITLGVAAFFLAMIHRSWVLNSGEEVLDDPEDVRIAMDQLRIDQESQLAAGEARYDTGVDVERRAPSSPDAGGIT
jgi:multicomponent Na+:H+ antiporter subunit C